jgi:hypothetical protein
MQHNHIPEVDTGRSTKLVVIISVVIGLCAIGLFLAYGTSTMM